MRPSHLVRLLLLALAGLLLCAPRALARPAAHPPPATKHDQRHAQHPARRAARHAVRPAVRHRVRRGARANAADTPPAPAVGVPRPTGKIYYVSPTGNDANSGLSQ